MKGIPRTLIQQIYAALHQKPLPRQEALQVGALSALCTNFFHGLRKDSRLNEWLASLQDILDESHIVPHKGSRYDFNSKVWEAGSVGKLLAPKVSGPKHHFPGT